MSGFVSYLMNFVPIPLGILAFYLIRSVRLSGRKVRIYTEVGGKAKGEDSGGLAGRPADLSLHGKFESFVRSMLIVNGRLGKRRRKEYSAVGFSEIGVLSVQNLESLPEYLARGRRERIGVFLTGAGSLPKELLAFGKGSGILVSYSSDNKLDVIGDAE